MKETTENLMQDGPVPTASEKTVPVKFEADATLVLQAEKPRIFQGRSYLLSRVMYRYPEDFPPLLPPVNLTGEPWMVTL